jgi:hypothetical protein
VRAMDADGLRAWLASGDPGLPPAETSRPWWPWYRTPPAPVPPPGTTTVVEMAVGVADKYPRHLVMCLDADGRPLGRLAVSTRIELAADRPDVPDVTYRRCPEIVRRSAVESVWPGSTAGASFHPWRTSLVFTVAFLVVLVAVILLVQAAHG